MWQMPSFSVTYPADGGGANVSPDWPLRNTLFLGKSLMSPAASAVWWHLKINNQNGSVFGK